MSSISGDIDFHQLERELAKTCEEADRYQQQNDAKFRAVHQKVESYEQFEGIVKACHLKPLDRGDLNGKDSRSHKWNHFSDGVEKNSDIIETKLSIPPSSFCESGTVPSSSLTFQRTWRHCNNNIDKITLLRNTNPEKFSQLFKKEISSEIFEGIIVCLAEKTLDDNAEFVLAWLKALTQCGRFNVAKIMLSKDKEMLLRTIFDSLSSLVYENSERFQSLKYQYM